MVSPALSQLLERARVRFGLDVEILDAGLNNLYPEGGTDLSRIIKDSPGVRRTLLEVIAGGRPQGLEGAGVGYGVYPLKRSSTRRQAACLLAIKCSQPDVSRALTAEPWSDLARAMVEADLASLDTLGEERQRSRRLVGVLRFLDCVIDTTDESTLARVLVQAAAVWYDVDARIYRRNLRGDFDLVTWLPGVQPDTTSMVLGSHLLRNETELRWVASAGDPGEAGTNHARSTEHAALVVPLTSTSRADWVLVLSGTMPPDADTVLRLIGRVAGTQFSSLAVRRWDDARLQFEALVTQTTKVPELVAVQVVHRLVQAVNASSGSLTLTRKGHARRIAAIGPVAGDAASAVDTDGLLAPDRFVCVLPLGSHGDDDRAVLELRPAGGSELSPDAAIAAQACASVLRTWLAGTLSSFDATTALLELDVIGGPAFSARIQEELERAKRFDLRLSLILIEVTAPADTVAQLQDALRRELRGSDLTGAMSGGQVVALLTHTDALGLDNVVRRVKQRLADAAERLQVSDLKLGQAAFSPEVRTADAFLELALRKSEPVIVH